MPLLVVFIQTGRYSGRYSPIDEINPSRHDRIPCSSSCVRTDTGVAGEVQLRWRQARATKKKILEAKPDKQKKETREGDPMSSTPL